MGPFEWRKLFLADAVILAMLRLALQGTRLAGFPVRTGRAETSFSDVIRALAT